MKLKTVTTINGRLVTKDKAKISVFDNALLYAEGLFETLLVAGDKIAYEKEHLARLFKGAAVIGLKVPVGKKQLSSWMRKTVKAHPNQIIKLRLTVTSGESARWVGTQGKPQVLLTASPHIMPERPFELYVSDYRIDQVSVFCQIKTISYIIHAAALNQAKKKKCDDALLLNNNNKVAEISSANIFWVTKKRIYTPPIAAGCLEGIMRRAVLREAAKLGHNITEKNITLEQLVKADEIFISSSLKLVIPVSVIKTDHRSYKIKQGDITRQFAAHFRQLVGL